MLLAGYSVKTYKLVHAIAQAFSSQTLTTESTGSVPEREAGTIIQYHDFQQ